MAPARARTSTDDTRTENHHGRERVPNSHTSAPRSRKQGASAAAQNQAAKESASVTSSNANTTQATTVQGFHGNGISWNLEDISFLEAYRIAYHVETQSAFHSVLTTAVLTSPGIGRHSPTMARKKEKRKVNKDNLSLAVRKHFNSLAVNETDVVVNFLYKAKVQDLNFRMRFAPSKQR